MPHQPPQSYAKGQRQTLDRLWLAYLADGGPAGNGAALLSAPGFADGIRAFNAGDYFDAHELFEQAWRSTPYPDRLLPWALSKLGAACHHASEHRGTSTKKLARDASIVLEALPRSFGGLDLLSFRAAVALWIADPDTPLELRKLA